MGGQRDRDMGRERGTTRRSILDLAILVLDIQRLQKTDMYKFGAVYKDNIKINEADTLFTYQRDHGKYGVVGEFKKVELDTNIGSKVVLQENLDDALAYKKAMGEKHGGRSIGAHMRATMLV